MKKMLALFCTLLLICGLSACKPTTPEEPQVDTPQEMPADMEAMAAPMDALARCMLENNLTYAPDDTDFFWTAMFYFTGGYGLEHPLAAEHDVTYQLILPTEAMEDYAEALFADFADALPALPAIMEGNISYAPEENAYFISRGDIGLSECRLSNFAKTEDGYTVTAELWSTGDSIAKIAAWDVTLVDGAEDALYPYRIAAMTMQAEDTDNTAASVQTTTALFNGLADSHTVELTLPDGTVQAFQFDPDSESAKVLSALLEGDGLTIQYTNTANGGLLITSVE